MDRGESTVPDADAEALASDTDDVLTVQQLNERIESVVTDTPSLHDVRCRGEVTDLSQSNTALYFNITDGETKLPCTIWASRYRNMDIDLEDGTEIILEGNIDYWVEGGQLDLKPWEVILVGDGDQAAAVEQLQAELQERGWFNDDHKRRPPRFPDRVGVVTSHQGDARYDIQNAIHEQDSSVDILVKDATVQGSNASASIANGIHYLDRSENVDAIIVGHGGGSDLNLQAFNTERVAEVIFTAKTPVVTSIGHTEDRLIADHVADVTTITPTAAGECIAESREEFISTEVESLGQKLDAVYESFEQEHKHEQELEQAVEEAKEPAGISPAYYKIAIAILFLLLLIITALWLGVI